MFQLQKAGFSGMGYRPELPGPKPKQAAFAADASGLMSGVPRGYVLPGVRFGGQAKLDAFEKVFREKTGFALDPFQRQSIRILYEGKSPVVAAATSSGKTLVAEAAIRDALESGKRVFYTAPRKAISNYMFNEFCDKYGRENVGLLTGDVTVNPEARVVLMTTEIFRNMLYQPEASRHRFRDLKYVVFDECHFINDPERGTVWEESALYARKLLPDVQQLHLSATVGNPEEYRDWLNSLNTAGNKAGEFELVNHPHRPVPLTVQYLSLQNGTLVDVLDTEGLPTPAFERAFSQNKKHPRATRFDPVFTVKALERADQLPLIEFIFSRKYCNLYAEQLLEADLQLTTAREQDQINAVIDSYVAAYPSMAGSRLLPFLVEGIAYHHADMWPREKELVEELLKKKLLKAVFATTTLAEGVNVPAQTVGISALDIRKKEGLQPVTGSEFHQMSGRAGRRGMFEQGYVILAHPEDHDMGRILTLIRSGPINLNSQFKVNPHMTLQLLDRLKDPARINILLEEGFRAFQLRREMPPALKKGKRFRRRDKKAALQAHQAKASVLRQEFKAMRQYLIATGYVRENNTLTDLGRLASQIPLESNLLVAKALQSGLLDGLEPPDLAALLAATVDDQISQEQKYGWDIAESSEDPALGRKLEKLEDLESLLMHAAGQAGVPVESRLAAGNVDRIARWCRTHDMRVLADSPGRLSYTIMRTANLLRHIEESDLANASLKQKVAQARALLLDGVIMEQLQPNKADRTDT